MANSTYIQLTNKLLRRLNEVEISQSDFLNTRGVQSLAKDAIQAAIRKITQTTIEWPFNAVQTEQILTPGVSEYNWLEDFRVPDWESFIIKKDTILNVSNTVLDYLDRDRWYQYLRTNDRNADTLGRNKPEYVFESHGTGFGVSPSPNYAYTVQYRYYRNASTLVNATDTSYIPDLWDEVIIQAGVYHMYMFRGNADQSQLAEQFYNNLLKDMRSVLSVKSDRVHSTILTRI